MQKSPTAFDRITNPIIDLPEANIKDLTPKQAYALMKVMEPFSKKHIIGDPN